MNRALLETHLLRLIVRYFSEKGRSLRFLLIAVLVPTILAIDLVLRRASLGVLYIIPMVLASVSMGDGETTVLALLCAILSWWGYTSASRIDAALYFIFSFISYACVAYFVTGLLRGHRMAIDNRKLVEEERGLRREAEARSKDRQMELSGMLINAQEKERSRLASEIHDDFSQRLALIALDLENAEETIGVSPDEAIKQLHNIMNSASEIGADLHTLSHRLHSATLERLGLLPGVRALCREFAVQQGIEVDFLTDHIPRSVHPDVALCIFRIVQEGLRNSKKHSGAAKAQVRLRRVGDKLLVSVSDEGVGFDLHDLGTKEGLGIRSMEERAYVLEGQFEIHSKPGQGTRIDASIPLHPKSDHRQDESGIGDGLSRRDIGKPENKLQ
jgi:signal transduction histidine kinase